MGYIGSDGGSWTGSTTNHFRVYATWHVDGYDDYDALTINTYHEVRDGWRFEINHVTGSESAKWDGTWYNAYGSERSVNAGGTGTTTWLSSATWNIPKAHSSRYVELWAQVQSKSTYLPGTSEGSSGYTIAAKTNHEWYYDNNGGSGGPSSSSTKWYGEQLHIHSTVPTRKNYTFMGWNTARDGSGTTYWPGNDYWTDDVSATLYAQWKLAFLPPSGSLSAYRVSNESDTTKDNDGEYIYAEFKWSVDTTVTPENHLKVLKLSYAKTSDTSSNAWTTLTPDNAPSTSDTSATTKVHFKADTTTSYVVQAYLLDNNDQFKNLEASVGIAVIPIDIQHKGAGIGLHAAAPDLGVRLGLPAMLSGDSDMPILGVVDYKFDNADDDISPSGGETDEIMALQHANYIKFSNGFAIAWARWHDTHGSFAATANIFYDTTIHAGMMYPFPIYNPTFFQTTIFGDGNGWTSPVSGTDTENQSANYYLLTQRDSYNDIIYTKVVVVGWWKDPTETVSTESNTQSNTT